MPSALVDAIFVIVYVMGDPEELTQTLPLFVLPEIVSVGAAPCGTISPVPARIMGIPQIL